MRDLYAERYEKEIPVLNEEWYCGKVRSYVKEERIDPNNWVDKNWKSKDPYAIYTLGLVDGDDWGGVIFYLIPLEKAEEVKQKLIEWVDHLAWDGIMDTHDVWQDGFFPSFEGCVVVNNW